MYSDILNGWVIDIKPVDEADSFQKGDVITYRTEDNTLVTHRIVEVKNEGKQYITQGDNNDDPDAQPEIGRDTSELQSRGHLVCRLLLEKKKENKKRITKTV